MLVLSRKVNEEIFIYTDNGTVKVMVVGVQGDNVRLGITAPNDVSVHRREVAESIAMNGEDPSDPAGRQRRSQKTA